MRLLQTQTGRSGIADFAAIILASHLCPDIAALCRIAVLPEVARGTSVANRQDPILREKPAPQLATDAS